MGNAVHSRVHTLKDTWDLGRQMSHLSAQTTLDGLFKRSKTSTAFYSSIIE
jgi:hypothetical protein